MGVSTSTECAAVPGDTVYVHSGEYTEAVVTVGAPDERRVDAGVLGGRDVRFVIADEQRRVGIEID